MTTKGTGSGAPTQSGNIKPRRKNRSKTAKTNRCAIIFQSISLKLNLISRVGPVPELERTCKSATEQVDSDGDESPDPLEPWSTKKIENMNKILAWEQDDDSL